MQHHALPLGHHRHFLKVEDDKLAVIANAGNVIMRLGDFADDSNARIAFEVHNLPPLLGFGEQFLGFGHKSLADC